MASNAPIATARLCARSHLVRAPSDAAENERVLPSEQMAKRAPISLARNLLHRELSERERQMPRLLFPNRLERDRAREPNGRECPAHRAWVRRHHCCVPGCLRRPIECAHVRCNTDGGVALKPSDRWSISLCRDHHIEQHRVGELAFEQRYGIDLHALADLFASRSPHRRRLGAADSDRSAY